MATQPPGAAPIWNFLEPGFRESIPCREKEDRELFLLHGERGCELVGRKHGPELGWLFGRSVRDWANTSNLLF